MVMVCCREELRGRPLVELVTPVPLVAMMVMRLDESVGSRMPMPGRLSVTVRHGLNEYAEWRLVMNQSELDEPVGSQMAPACCWSELHGRVLVLTVEMWAD